ncbi:MAG: serine/threonine protein phosphatase [Sphingobium sp.]|nr:serine/threonine protein phosphatase [Sphingobium sp.]
MVEGQLIYAIGDIHGCYDPLRDLLARISHDAEIHAAGRTACLIFCGDYIDRGPSSAQVLDALCWLKRYGPYHMHFLKGNHEAAMLDYIADPGSMREWLRFGGTETLLSYGLTPPGAEAPAPAHVAARDDLLERMPVAHLRFLEQLELMVGVGDYAFVHAGIRPGVPLAEQEEEDLLWIRKGFVDVDRPHERIIVHGHSISAEPEMLPHRIGIDTGAYKTGVLTALRLEDGSAAFLATR